MQSIRCITVGQRGRMVTHLITFTGFGFQRLFIVLDFTIPYQTLLKKCVNVDEIEIAHFKNNKGKCLVCNNFTSKHTADIRTHLQVIHNWKIEA